MGCPGQSHTLMGHHRALRDILRAVVAGHAAGRAATSSRDVHRALNRTRANAAYALTARLHTRTPRRVILFRAAATRTAAQVRAEYRNVTVGIGAWEEEGLPSPMPASPGTHLCHASAACLPPPAPALCLPHVCT